MLLAADIIVSLLVVETQVEWFRPRPAVTIAKVLCKIDWFSGYDCHDERRIKESRMVQRLRVSKLKVYFEVNVTSTCQGGKWGVPCKVCSFRLNE